jgi:Mn-dependent DtxR family transcriptional regulator
LTPGDEELEMEPNGSLWDLQADADTGLDPAADTIAAEILDVIARCPDGARARDVGNRLGVDWRRVVAIVSRLIDAGAVEEIQQRLYSVAKASRQC